MDSPPEPGEVKPPETPRALLRRALASPRALIAGAGSMAIGLGALRSEEALLIGLAAYLLAVGILLMRPDLLRPLTWDRDVRRSRTAQSQPDAQTQMAHPASLTPVAIPAHVTALMAELTPLVDGIARVVASSPPSMRRALKPVVAEVDRLRHHALRFAHGLADADHHLTLAREEGLAAERDALLARVAVEKDPLVREQLSEAAAAVARRVEDLDKLRVVRSRCEAALLNIRTTLAGFHTRVLRITASEQSWGGDGRTELAHEVDHLRATSSALDEVISEPGTVDA